MLSNLPNRSFAAPRLGVRKNFKTPTPTTQRYRKIRCLKEGGFGKAYLCQSQDPRSPYYVVKEMKTKDLSPSKLSSMKTEASILKSLTHKNIIAFKESYTSPSSKFCIVMDYASRGDLKSLIQTKSPTHPFTEPQILDYFAQICLALDHIHSHKIVHRDLKPENIFITQKNTIKLGDFGISTILTDTNQLLNTFVGTPHYISPEIIRGQPYSFKTDIWSLGVILYELCMLR